MSELSYRDVPLPWQTSIWHDLHDRFVKNKLPHALLITGIDGFGQNLFATALARSLITQDNASQLHLFDSGHHPDFFYIQPETNGEAIQIDQIRALKNKLITTRHSGSVRVVCFYPAHALTIAASNALLKLVEEPNDATFLFFVSSQPQKLKTTLRSRCQRVNFSETNPPLILAWVREQLTDHSKAAAYFLKLAEGAPLTALSLAKKPAQQLRKDFFMDVHALLMIQISPSNLAHKWAKQPIDTLLCLLLVWLLDVVRLHHQVLINNIFPIQYYQIVCQWREKLALLKIYATIEKIHKARTILSQHSSVNKQSMLESVFVDLL